MSDSPLQLEEVTWITSSPSALIFTYKGYYDTDSASSSVTLQYITSTAYGWASTENTSLTGTLVLNRAHGNLIDPSTKFHVGFRFITDTGKLSNEIYLDVMSSPRINVEINQAELGFKSLTFNYSATEVLYKLRYYIYNEDDEKEPAPSQYTELPGGYQNGSFTIGDLLPGTKYTFLIEATSEYNGHYPPSNQLTIIVATQTPVDITSESIIAMYGRIFNFDIYNPSNISARAILLYTDEENNSQSIITQEIVYRHESPYKYNYIVTVTENAWDKLYRTFGFTNKIDIEFGIQSTANNGGTYSIIRRLCAVHLDGTQRTMHIVVKSDSSNMLQRMRCQVWIGDENNVPRKAVAWIGDSSNTPRRTI